MFSKKHVQSIQLFTPGSFEQAKAEMQFAPGKHFRIPSGENQIGHSGGGCYTETQGGLGASAMLLLRNDLFISMMLLFESSGF
jgi:hypothetical protein